MLMFCQRYRDAPTQQQSSLLILVIFATLRALPPPDFAASRRSSEDYTLIISPKIAPRMPREAMPALLSMIFAPAPAHTPAASTLSHATMLRALCWLYAPPARAMPSRTRHVYAGADATRC